jgi:hypothetical protein
MSAAPHGDLERRFDAPAYMQDVLGLDQNGSVAMTANVEIWLSGRQRGASRPSGGSALYGVSERTIMPGLQWWD